MALITPAGQISWLAGGGDSAQLGDGKLATQASLGVLNTAGIAVDRKGNLYIADPDNSRVREVPATPPTMQLEQSSFAFTGNSGGALISQSLLVTGSISGLEFQVTTKTVDGGTWLSISASSGATPELLTVTVDPSRTPTAGRYTGTITITPAAATPATLTATVTFTVSDALPAQLSVDRPNLSFAFPKGAAALTQKIGISNSGGGSVQFTVQAAAKPDWLSFTPASESASPASPVVVQVRADPGTLSGVGCTDGIPVVSDAPGTYTGSIVIAAGSAGSVTIPVTMTVSCVSQGLLLTQTGMSFRAVEKGGIIPSQAFGVINTGVGTLNWISSVSTLSGGDWLFRTPPSGFSAAATLTTRI